MTFNPFKKIVINSAETIQSFVKDDSSIELKNSLNSKIPKKSIIYNFLNFKLKSLLLSLMLVTIVIMGFIGSFYIARTPISRVLGIKTYSNFTCDLEQNLTKKDMVDFVFNDNKELMKNNINTFKSYYSPAVVNEYKSLVEVYSVPRYGNADESDKIFQNATGVYYIISAEKEELKNISYKNFVLRNICSLQKNLKYSNSNNLELISDFEVKDLNTYMEIIKSQSSDNEVKFFLNAIEGKYNKLNNYERLYQELTKFINKY